MRKKKSFGYTPCNTYQSFIFHIYSITFQCICIQKPPVDSDDEVDDAAADDAEIAVGSDDDEAEEADSDDEEGEQQDEEIIRSSKVNTQAIPGPKKIVAKSPPAPVKAALVKKAPRPLKKVKSTTPTTNTNIKNVNKNKKQRIK